MVIHKNIKSVWALLKDEENFEYLPDYGKLKKSKEARSKQTVHIAPQIVPEKKEEIKKPEPPRAKETPNEKAEKPDKEVKEKKESAKENKTKEIKPIKEENRPSKKSEKIKEESEEKLAKDSEKPSQKEEALIIKETNKVFVAHGKDKELVDKVLDFVKEIGVEPVFPKDSKNKTKPITLILKENPEVNFAIIILTADDFTYPKNGKPKDALLRSAQDAVFQLGFWIGRLGRSNVLALHYDQKSFRMPTEYFDALYTPIDKTNLWKKELVSRLKQAAVKITEPAKSKK